MKQVAKGSVFFSLFFGALVAVVASGSIFEAVAQVENNLFIRYDPNRAVFTVISNFKRRVTGACRLRLRGGVAYEGAVASESARTLLDYRFTGVRRVKFEVRGVPGVVDNEDGDRAILTVQGRLTCNRGEVNLVSNADARYVNCGEGRQDVSPQRFLENLSAGLRTAASAN